MSFFERKRKALIPAGIDPIRLPPGQYSTDRFPVLHVGAVPDYGDLSTWTLDAVGAVSSPRTFTWQQLLDLPSITTTSTTW